MLNMRNIVILLIGIALGLYVVPRFFPGMTA